MKLFLASDIHREFYENPQEIEIPLCDVIVLAGDISKMEEALSYCSHLAEHHDIPVIFVPGNHEYYNGNYTDLSVIARNYNDKKVHILMDDMTVIDGVRFIGSTLWTDFSAGTNGNEGWISRNKRLAKRYINDFRVIRVSNDRNNKLRPVHVVEFYNQSCEYFRQQLEKPFEGKTVIVTHFCPSIKLEDLKYKGSEVSPLLQC